jgi:hypothetical protein
VPSSGWEAHYLMQLGTLGNYPFTLGRLIALVVLLVVIVFLALGQLDLRLGLLLGGLALASLL